MTQDQALKILKKGNNVFLTGAAGSGKTYVLGKFIEYLKAKNVAVGITASTGIAATHLSGMTIHSWTGIGIKDFLTDKDLDAILGKKYLKTRFHKANILIIDEISMLHAHRLDMIDRVCRAFKEKDTAFGGMQIVMCGDFFQLPPVTRGEEAGDFAYKSNIWNNMDLSICYLEEQYRQSDRAFLRVLSDIRTDSVNDDTVNYLLERYNQEVRGKIKPTRLYTHNTDVDAINEMELSKINHPCHSYAMTSRGHKDLLEFLRKSCLAPETLNIKFGAIVMFVKNNFDKGYVNGTLGKVIGFDDNDYPIVETTTGLEIIANPASWIIEEEHKSLAEICQIPLRLAWAITIHKSQGMSLDAAEIDLSKSFVPGMGYVALSRVRTLAGMKLVGLNEMSLTVNPEVLAMDKLFQEKSD
ncbi:MAG: PIF1 family DEAD/DEAH box helicase [Candidatus Amesbacteria bacterium]|nr:PIF1 family DEAD/DEAH box helicase [Candidatus Amesbacteria bacterium]